jgi:putative DNA primase/helicase
MSISFQPHDYAKYLASSGNYATENGTLLEWTGIYWKPLESSELERSAYKWLVDHRPEFATPTNAAIAIRAAMLHCPRLPSPVRDTVIPCRNGYVEVDENGVRQVPASPAQGLKYVLNCLYDPGAGTPVRFQTFLDTVLPDKDVQKRVQEYAAYTLTSDARYQRAQLWKGGGANGKGVLARIIQAMHGNATAIDLGSIGERFSLAPLVDASLIYSDEAPKGRINESVLKSLIAGETVLVERKYKDPISSRINGKFLMLSNHVPEIIDHSDGFYRRLDIVPFDVTIPEHKREPGLAESIIGAELSGVLNWALEGLVRLRRRGRFDPVLPEIMAQMLVSAKCLTNPIRSWISDVFVELSSRSEPAEKQLVYQHFADWCRRNGIAPMSSPRFWTDLRQVLNVDHWRKRGSLGGQVWVCNLKIPEVKLWTA